MSFGFYLYFHNCFEIIEIVFFFLILFGILKTSFLFPLSISIIAMTFFLCIPAQDNLSSWIFDLLSIIFIYRDGDLCDQCSKMILRNAYNFKMIVWWWNFEETLITWFVKRKDRNVFFFFSFRKGEIISFSRFLALKFCWEKS